MHLDDRTIVVMKCHCGLDLLGLGRRLLSGVIGVLCHTSFSIAPALAACGNGHYCEGGDEALDMGGRLLQECADAGVAVEPTLSAQDITMNK